MNCRSLYVQVRTVVDRKTLDVVAPTPEFIMDEYDVDAANSAVTVTLSEPAS